MHRRVHSARDERGGRLSQRRKLVPTTHKEAGHQRTLHGFHARISRHGVGKARKPAPLHRRDGGRKVKNGFRAAQRKGRHVDSGAEHRDAGNLRQLAVNPDIPVAGLGQVVWVALRQWEFFRSWRGVAIQSTARGEAGIGLGLSLIQRVASFGVDIAATRASASFGRSYRLHAGCGPIAGGGKPSRG